MGVSFLSHSFGFYKGVLFFLVDYIDIIVDDFTLVLFASDVIFSLDIMPFFLKMMKRDVGWLFWMTASYSSGGCGELSRTVIASKMISLVIIGML